MSTQDEVKKALRLLSTLLKIAELPQKELDVRLGQGRGYSSQVLTGRVALKYKHLLGMLEALDVKPMVFFSILHHGPEGMPLQDNDVVRMLESLHAVGFEDSEAKHAASPALPTQPPVATDPAELTRIIQAAVVEALGVRQPAKDKPAGGKPTGRKPAAKRKPSGPKKR
ncbi:MAG TPA: hypothetical protein VOA87_06715 [Thermoanaerobaculia bacterium]|nr:hypothetical protein [Thermoanaerobaculia bacterium]